MVMVQRAVVTSSTNKRGGDFQRHDSELLLETTSGTKAVIKWLTESVEHRQLCLKDRTKMLDSWAYIAYLQYIPACLVLVSCAWRPVLVLGTYINRAQSF